MRHRTIIGCLPVVAVVAVMTACAGSRPSTAQKQNELIARRLMAVWESGDTSTVVDLFQPDAVYDDYAGQQQYHGIQEIVEHIFSIQAWATNISMNVGEVHTGPTSAVAEWTLSLVQDRPMGSLVPMATNREVVLNGVTILEISGGRISRAADYWDASQLAVQLGGKVVFPGGAVWQQNGDTTKAGVGQ